MDSGSTLSTAGAVPLPRWGRLRGRSFYIGRCPLFGSQKAPSLREGAARRAGDRETVEQVVVQYRRD